MHRRAHRSGFDVHVDMGNGDRILSVFLNRASSVTLRTVERATCNLILEGSDCTAEEVEDVTRMGEFISLDIKRVNRVQNNEGNEFHS